MAFYSDFAGHYDAVFPLRPAALDFLARWLPARGRLLDVGCGVGTYAAALNARGRSCLGIDPDPGMVDEARRRDPGGDYRLLGMEDAGRLEAGGFAGAWCIGNVLPHLPATALAGFLRDVHLLLAPRGRWIVQTVNFDALTPGTDHVFPVLGDPDGDVAFHRAYRDVRPDRLVFATRLEADGREVFRAETTLHPRTSAEYRAAHRAAGFAPLLHAADWAGRRFAPRAAGGSVFVWERA